MLPWQNWISPKAFTERFTLSLDKWTAVQLKHAKIENNARTPRYSYIYLKLTRTVGCMSIEQSHS